MSNTKGFAAQNASSQLAPFQFARREVGAKDVMIEIDFCGVCHSDIHQVRDEWGGSVFPMVPGHEIVGHVTAGRESGREEQQELTKGTLINIGAHAFHQNQSFGPGLVSQPMLQLWPRVVVQIDCQMLNMIKFPPALR